jgi:hypothetical protein
MEATLKFFGKIEFKYYYVQHSRFDLKIFPMLIQDSYN